MKGYVNRQTKTSEKKIEC